MQDYNLVIDDEFESLLPPLPEDKLLGLENEILAVGILCPIEVWKGNGIIVDGHNRYKIAMKHNLEYKVVELEFSSRADVARYIIDHQENRRNLSDLQRIGIAHRFAAIVKAEARKRQSESGGDKKSESYKSERESLVAIFPQAISEDRAPSARDELGKIAGVSGRTYEHGVYAIKHAPKQVVDAANRNELTVNAAYQVAKMTPENQEEVVRLIEKGEQPRKAVKEVRQQTHVENEEPQEDGHDLDDFDTPSGQATLYIGNNVNEVMLCDLLVTEAPKADDQDEFVDKWLYKALSGISQTGYGYVFIDDDIDTMCAYLNADVPPNVELVQVLVWKFKYLLGNKLNRQYKPDVKFILFYRGIESKPLDRVTVHEWSSVFDFDAEGGNLGDRVYELKMPMDLAERIIRQSTDEGAMVYDPFAKRGTFLLAASRLGRDAIGYEEDETLAEEAFKRGVTRG